MAEDTEDKILQLGGNIELSGFHDMDRGVMIILKKMVGNYARKMSDRIKNFEKLSLHLKKVHEKEKGEIYEIHARMLNDGGKLLTSIQTDRNLFVAADIALKNVLKQVKE